MAPKRRTMNADEDASLERLLESEALGLDVLHPGGTEITAALADRCDVGEGTTVLDAACGTGESDRLLAARYGCSVLGVDASLDLLTRARAKTTTTAVSFAAGDALRLPVRDDGFDVVVQECATCLLPDPAAGIEELARVATPGGFVGMHDLSWAEGTPAETRQRLADLEGERPETLDGWRRLFERAGLVDVEVEDRSSALDAWMEEVHADLGVTGQLRGFAAAARRWGLGGLWRVRTAQRVFESGDVGYALVVGRKP